MKAGQLIKVLQLVDPNEDVFFSVGSDKEERQNLLDIVGGDPDIFTDMRAEMAELVEIKGGMLRLNINLYPINVVPDDI